MNPLILLDLAGRVADRIIKAPDIRADTPAEKPVIQQEVLQELRPTIEHLTNSEPWYQSRVTWGAIIAAASPILAPFVGRALSPEEQALWTSVLTAVGTGIGAGITLYGRWKAKKPLGA